MEKSKNKDSIIISSRRTKTKKGKFVNRKVVYYRENNRLVSWNYLTNLQGVSNKKTAVSYFKEKGSFRVIKTKQVSIVRGKKKISYKTEAVYGKRSKLKNFDRRSEEYQVKLSDRNKPPKLEKPSGKRLQYFVIGTYKNEEVSGHSSRLGSPLAPTPKAAKEQAWRNFLGQVGRVETNGKITDEAEGEKVMSKIENLREGWVSFDEKR